MRKSCRIFVSYQYGNTLKTLSLMSVSINTQYNDTQILKAIESIAQRFVVLIHDEAKGYAFKYTDGTWGFAKYDFVHDIAKGYNKKGKLIPFA